MSFIKNITFNRVLIFLGVLILIIFTSREFLPYEMQIWITIHLRVFVSSILITLISGLIGLLKSEDIEDSESLPILLPLQIFFSYFYDSKLLDSGTILFYFFWLFPTIVFIARTYFKRIKRIENMLLEQKNTEKHFK